MQEPKRNTKKDNRLLEYTKRHLTRKIIVSLLIVLALAAVVDSICILHASQRHRFFKETLWSENSIYTE